MMSHAIQCRANFASFATLCMTDQAFFFEEYSTFLEISRPVCQFTKLSKLEGLFSSLLLIQQDGAIQNGFNRGLSICGPPFLILINTDQAFGEI